MEMYTAGDVGVHSSSNVQATVCDTWCALEPWMRVTDELNGLAVCSPEANCEMGISE